MSAVYGICGVSKQAYFQHRTSESQRQIMEEIILGEVGRLRQRHRSMGARKMYWKLSPLPIGRDRFEELVLAHGYRVRVNRNYTKTTHRHKRYLCYPNLCADLVVRRINRVWSSDITYYRVMDRFYYLVFEMDLYSRRILGSAVSQTLEATGNVEALEKAFATRGFATYQYQLIHHSDPGSQYLSEEVLEVCRHRKCRVSIGKSVWENPHIERVNGIIKNEYLRHYSITTIVELQKAVSEAIWYYNNDRPHWSLQLMTPVEFECYVKGIPRNERPILCPYSENNSVK